jgi:hypothetical protein
MAHTSAFEAGYKPGKVVLYKIAASTTIYKGALVALKTDGYLIPIAHGTANLRFAGIAEETVINSGADGAASVRVSKSGSFAIAGTAVQADVGKEVYAVDDATVQIGTIGLTNQYKVGTMLATETTSKGVAGLRVRIGNYTL